MNSKKKKKKKKGNPCFQIFEDPRFQTRSQLASVIYDTLAHGVYPISTMVNALVLMDRIIPQGLTLTVTNCFWPYYICLMLSHKTLEDAHYSNGGYAKMIQEPLSKINQLESITLKLLDWECHSSTKEYEEYLSALTGERFYEVQYQC